jgi:hypothetical protein
MDTAMVRLVAITASESLQQIQQLTGREEVEEARVRFPRGFILTAAQRRKRLQFVRNETVRKNVAYTLMVYDVYLWILRRTDLASTARDMLVKSCLATLGAVAEAILNDWFSREMGKRQRFVTRTRRLSLDGVIDEELEEELNWVWEMRNRQHLFELGSEFEFYSVEDQRRAGRAVSALLDRLSDRQGLTKGEAS